MTTPLNKELQELRVLINHYNNILEYDEKIKSNEVESDGRPLLTKYDINRINDTLKYLTDKRDDLLDKDNEFH